MPPAQISHGLTPSVLDRLIDASADADTSAWCDAAALADCIYRDVEDLLNTHATPPPNMEGYPALERSLLAYGLPDTLIHDGATGVDQSELAESIRLALERFEPRLGGVRVEILDPLGTSRRVLRFRIEARLEAESSPLLSFETSVNVTTRKFEVRRIRR